MRLTSSRRLASHGEFARVKSEGRSERGRFIILGVLQTGDGKPWRCGFITSRKAGNAVKRNLIRRRLREIVRETGELLGSGTWIVIIARWNCAAATFDELRNDWTKTAGRAGIFQKKPTA